MKKSPTPRWLALAAAVCAAAGCDKTPPGPQPNAAVTKTAAAQAKPWKELLKDLGSDDAGAAATAVRALAAAGAANAEVVKALLEALRGDDPMRASDAANVLVAIHDTAIVPEVIDILRTPKSRESARAVLAAIATPQAIPAVAPLVMDKDAYVRSTAVDVLASLGGADALDALKAGLASDDYRTRRHIAAVLGDTKDKRVVPVLIELLSDPSGQVEEEADLALRRMSGKDMGFRTYATAEDRAQAIAAWKKWAAGGK